MRFPLLGRTRLKPFGMACLAEEFRLAVTPRLRRTVIVTGCRTTAATLEYKGRRLALWHEHGNNANNYNNRDHCPNEYFRRHEVSPYA